MYVAELPNRTRGEDNWVTIIKTVIEAGIHPLSDQTRPGTRNRNRNTSMIAKRAYRRTKKKQEKQKREEASWKFEIEVEM
jgi:hypothetical protein